MVQASGSTNSMELTTVLSLNEAIHEVRGDLHAEVHPVGSGEADVEGCVRQTPVTGMGILQSSNTLMASALPNSPMICGRGVATGSAGSVNADYREKGAG